jgi:hypothetical protein
VDFKDNPFARGRIPAPPVLDWKFPLLVAITVLSLAVPLGLWAGAADPALLKIFLTPWPSAWAQILAAALAFALFFLPLAWVLASRVYDLLAFFLAQNALLIAGYFFLGSTAWRFEEVARDILQAGSLVIVINAIGFAVLFATLGLTYFLAAASQARLPAIQAPPEDYDARLAWFLRASGLAVAVGLALPMALGGTIPMLAENPALARAAMVQSDFGRAFYNLGTGLMPFICGGLLIFCVRNPWRCLGPDGWIAGMILLTQLLSSNRFPLAIAFFVTITLLTIERRWPRPILLAAYGGFMLLLTGTSGLTSILRQDRDALEGGHVVQKSLEEAFYGDNLIDTRDAAWVLSQWDFEPLMGTTYLGGLTAMLPSGVFPQKKQWHLGLTGLRIVGWNPDQHFGLRITFFGESFLNFGPAGVVTLGLILGAVFGVLLRAVHLASGKRPPCLHYNLKIVILMQMGLPLANTSDAFTFWAMGAFLVVQWLCVDGTLGFRSPSPLHAPSRA